MNTDPSKMTAEKPKPLDRPTSAGWWWYRGIRRKGFYDWCVLRVYQDRDGVWMIDSGDGDDEPIERVGKGQWLPTQPPEL